MTMKNLICTRPAHCNATQEVYEVGQTYTVDIENPRNLKFFEFPDDDKECESWKKKHLALFAAEKAAKGKAKELEKPAAEKPAK